VKEITPFESGFEFISSILSGCEETIPSIWKYEYGQTV